MSVSEKDICLQIQLRFINPLKNLRRLGIKMISDIFLDWESYQFRVEEIDAVFHGAVWPQVNLDLISPPCLTLSTSPSVFIHTKVVCSAFLHQDFYFCKLLEHLVRPKDRKSVFKFCGIYTEG